MACRLVNSVCVVLLLLLLSIQPMECLQVWSDGEIKLEQGRLLMEYQRGDWRTVCNKEWDWEASGVACDQLSLGPPLRQLFPPVDSPPDVPILRGRFSCIGNERHLSYCLLKPLSEGTSCEHSDDVTIECTPAEFHNYDVVTVDDSSPAQLVLIRGYRSWYKVCGPYWGQAEASVICRQEGFAEGKLFYDSNIPTLFIRYRCFSQTVQCFGHENHLAECEWRPTDQSDGGAYLHVICGNNSSRLKEVAPTSFELFTDSTSGGPRTEIITLGVLVGALILSFLAGSLCVSKRRRQHTLEQSLERGVRQDLVQVISVRPIEEEYDMSHQTSIFRSDVQELPNDLPPSYEQYVTNPGLFRTMSEQTDVQHDLPQARVESPPPEYHDVLFLPPNDTLDAGEYGNGARRTATGNFSGVAPPLTPPPDYIHEPFLPPVRGRDGFEARGVSSDGFHGTIMETRQLSSRNDGGTNSWPGDGSQPSVRAIMDDNQEDLDSVSISTYTTSLSEASGSISISLEGSDGHRSDAESDFEYDTRL